MKTTFAELKGVEIFETGLWKGKRWTTTHLDEIVANFSKLREYLHPPAKLGHDDRQVIAEQEDGQPALGWVTRLYRRGEKLLADFADVPDLLVELIRKRRYNRVSSEIFIHFEDTLTASALAEKDAAVKDVHGPVLCGVAFLGADLPEVKTLEDLAAVLATGGREGCQVHYSDAAAGAERVDIPAERFKTYAPGSLYDFQERVMEVCRVTYPEKYFYFRDLFDDAVIVDFGDRLVRLSITEADGKLTLGDPVEVSVAYDPVKASDPGPAGRPVRNPPPEDTMLTDEQVKAMIDKAVGPAIEAATAAQATEFKTVTEALQSENKQLREDLKRVEASDASNARRARKVEITTFVESISRPGCLKILTTQRPYLVALLERLPVDVKLTAAEGLELAIFKSSDEAKDLSLPDLLKGLLLAGPDHKAMLREAGHGRVQGQPGTPETYEEARELVATRDKLNLKDPADLGKIARTVEREYPKLVLDECGITEEERQAG
jgi:hypothetical protein